MKSHIYIHIIQGNRLNDITNLNQIEFYECFPAGVNTRNFAVRQ